MKVKVELDDSDWQKVLAQLAQGPWAQVNPLIMQIGQQLMPRPNSQDETAKKPEEPPAGKRLS